MPGRCGSHLLRITRTNQAHALIYLFSFCDLEVFIKFITTPEINACLELLLEDLCNTLCSNKLQVDLTAQILEAITSRRMF